jgi:hypothetical protein
MLTLSMMNFKTTNMHVASDKKHEGNRPSYVLIWKSNKMEALTISSLMLQQLLQDLLSIPSVITQSKV